MGVEPIRLFVYGSLREGEYNHGRFGPQKNLGLYISPPQYLLIDLGAYPAMVQKQNATGGGVIGEIHEITPDMLPWFDRMEYGAGYHRAVDRFMPLSKKGQDIIAEVYIQPWMHWMEKRIIPSGDWKAHRKR